MGRLLRPEPGGRIGTLTDTFTELRPLLFSIADRMTGSRVDAEDAIQETYLRWQAADHDSVESPRAFLTTVISRICIDLLRSAHRKREVYTGHWLPEPIVGPSTEPVELAESLSLAFLHVLESLSPSERVAFLMHDVFDASYSEVADALETSGANARQLASRARDHLRRPKTRIERDKHQKLLWAFLQACTEGDAAALVGLLKQDAVLYSDGGGKTRAAINPIVGVDRIVRFILGIRQKGIGDLKAVPAEVNGEPGAAITRNGLPYMIHAIEVEDDRIRSIFYILNPDKLPREFPVTT
jgi:RNA polymerase sigma-70 factor (ECF subfamily)